MSDEQVTKTAEEIAAETKAAEETAAKAAPDEAAKKAEEDANKTPEQLEAENKAAEEAAATAKAATDEEAKKKEENHDVRRMKRLLREKFEAEAKAEALQNVLDGLQQQQPVNQEPKREQYATDEDFISAKVDFRLNQEFSKRQQVEQQQTNQKKAEEFARKAEEARKNIEDFDDVVLNASVRLYPEVTDAIYESPLSAQIAYELAKDGETEARKIASLPRHLAVKEIGKIEAKLELQKEAVKQVPKPVSKAPAPIKPVGGTAGATATPRDKLTDKEWTRLYGPYAHLHKKG